MSRRILPALLLIGAACGRGDQTEVGPERLAFDGSWKPGDFKEVRSEVGA